MAVTSLVQSSHEPSFQKTWGGQPGRMGVAATPKYTEGAYWTRRKKREFGGSDLICFDNHALYVGYNNSNVFYIAIKAAQGVWGLTSKRIFIITSPTMPENESANITSKLQSITFDIEKTVKR